MRHISPIRRLFQLLFFAAGTVSLIMASLPKPPGVPFELSDKIQHIMAFAVLAFLARIAFWEARALYIFISLSVFGALIECVQLIPILGRDADLVAWAADNVAVFAVRLLFNAYRLWVENRRRHL